MSASPSITIAMAMRNNGATLAYALESLLWQTFERWKLVLLDDGSSDDSLAVANNYKDPRIQIIADGRHLGLAARLNQAVDLAGSAYIARMDADDIAYPQRLAQQLEMLEQHAELDLVGAGALVFSGSGIAVGTLPLRATHEQICRRPWAGFYLAHPTWMGRTAWFRRYRYDPAALKAQDQVLLLGAYDASRFACLPEVLLGYRQETVSLGKVAAGRFHFCRGLIRSGQRRHAYGFMLRGILEQAAKLAFEAIVIPTGMARKVLRHRALPVSAAALGEWQRIWAELTRRVSARRAGNS